MSSELYKIVEAVNQEIKPMLPKMHSERQRIEMRATLMALERMVRSMRKQLLLESKNLKQFRKGKSKSPNIKEEEEKDDVNSPTSG